MDFRVGQNSELLFNEPRVIKIWYLPQINLSPTSFAEVDETLIRVKIIASGCGRENVTVTFYLTFAKMAWQIKVAELTKLAYLSIWGHFILSSLSSVSLVNRL